MGSRNSDGSRITQSNNVLWQYSRADVVKTRNSTVDEQRGSVASTGIANTATTSGIRFMPDEMTIQQRTASYSNEYLKYTDPSGNWPGYLTHKPTRAMGIHTSVSTRIVDSTAGSGALSCGPMRTVEERKVFYTDNDRNVSVANQSDWNIYDANGNTVGSSDGTTDTDSTPHDT